MFIYLPCGFFNLSGSLIRRRDFYLLLDLIISLAVLAANSWDWILWLEQEGGNWCFSCNNVSFFWTLRTDVTLNLVYV